MFVPCEKIEALDSNTLDIQELNFIQQSAQQLLCWANMTFAVISLSGNAFEF